MTDSKQITVAGATIDITIDGYPRGINIHITVDLGPLDRDEPPHGGHNLIEYINLNNYATRSAFWWRKLHRTVNVKTASQARRVIKHAVAKIDDAISAAQIARSARKAEISSVLA